MKINFLRLGHANNSSSSHSIIFNPAAKDKSNEDTEFGWGDFVCSSERDKACYAHSILVESLRGYLNISYNYVYAQDTKEQEALLIYSDVQKFREKVIKKILKKHFKWLTDILGNDMISADIDHQSLVRLPENRVTGKLDIVFANKLLKEFVLNDWAILGGNDNCDEHVPRFENLKETAEFIKVWRFLTDISDCQCMLDEKTDEWWISLNSGPLMRIQF